MNKFQELILDEAIENSHQLSEWEEQFIDSLDGKREFDLSEKQNSILTRINQKLKGL